MKLNRVQRIRKWRAYSDKVVAYVTEQVNKVFRLFAKLWGYKLFRMLCWTVVISLILFAIWLVMTEYQRTVEVGLYVDTTDTTSGTLTHTTSGTLTDTLTDGFRDINGDGKISVALSAGHSAMDTPGKEITDWLCPYSNAQGNVKEWTLNDTVCDRLQVHLEAQGIEVHRLDDVTGMTDIPLQQRYANASDYDTILSIHHNATSDYRSNATGVEAWYSHLSEESERLALDIAQKLSESVGLRNRGVKSTLDYDLFVPRVGQQHGVPTVLVEGGFMCSNNDIPIITSERYLDNYAKACADALLNFLTK